MLQLMEKVEYYRTTHNGLLQIKKAAGYKDLSFKITHSSIIISTTTTLTTQKSKIIIGICLKIRKNMLTKWIRSFQLQDIQFLLIKIRVYNWIQTEIILDKKILNGHTILYINRITLIKYIRKIQIAILNLVMVQRLQFQVAKVE